MLARSRPRPPGSADIMVTGQSFAIVYNGLSLSLFAKILYPALLSRRAIHPCAVGKPGSNSTFLHAPLSPVVLLITPDPMGQSASNSGDIDHSHHLWLLGCNTILGCRVSDTCSPCVAHDTNSHCFCLADSLRRTCGESAATRKTRHVCSPSKWMIENNKHCMFIATHCI